MNVEQIHLIDYTVPPETSKRSPTSVDLQLTGKCNLSCAYCYYADQMKSKQDLNTESWHSIISELGNLAVCSVTLSGGEPFMRNDLFTLIDYITDNKMRYTILSNGSLIDCDIIKKFSVGKRKIRLDTIQISIDGSCAEIHDLSRPPKSFKRAIRGINLLKEANLPVSVRVTLNAHNINDFDNIAHLLINELGFSTFSIDEAHSMGTARCQGKKILLSHEQRDIAVQKLMELNKQYDGKITVQGGPLAIAQRIGTIDQLCSSGEKYPDRKGTLSACWEVFSQMCILHDGTMVPCSMLPTLVMGVAGMHPIRDAWLYSPAINVVRYRGLIPLTSLSSCSACDYTGFCTGGCPADVMAENGNLLGIDPLSCYTYHKERGRF